MISRRNFALGSAKALMAFVAVASIPLGGCSAVTDLENWIPVALTAVSAIVKLLGPVIPAPVAATIVLIQMGFSALLTAIQNYKSGSGVLADIANAIAAVETAFQNFFASLSIPSTLLSTIEGLASIIISTIQAFANEINPASTTTSMTVGGRQLAVSPVKRSLRKFKEDWNTECLKDGAPSARI